METDQMRTNYWPDEYIEKRRTAEEAMQMIRSGQRVFFGSSCAEPQHLANTLISMADHFSDLEIVRLMSLTNSPITKLANENPYGNFNIRNIYHGSASAPHLAPSKPYITPITISAVPGLF